MLGQTGRNIVILILPRKEVVLRLVKLLLLILIIVKDVLLHIGQLLAHYISQPFR